MSSADEITELIEELYSITRVLQALSNKPNEYAGVSMYANETHTLKLIAENEGISQSELSDLMYRTKGATSVMVDKLVKKGLVNRVREKGNQRRYLLTLTELGTQIHTAHSKYDEDHARWVSEHLQLSEVDLKMANQTLKQVISFYSSHYLQDGKAVISPIEKCQ